MNNMDWNDIRVLIAVAETGALSSAARRLGTSQPTLGRRIDALERALGLTLFTRGPRGMALTEAGRDILAHARAMQEAAARLELAATGRAETLRGVVRVTAPEIMSAHHLPEIVADLIEAEPGLEVELVASDRTENLLLREADIAIRMYRPAQADLVARKVAELETGLYASHGYIARHGAPTEIDFSRHRMVGYDRNPAITDWMAAHGLAPPRAFFRARTDNQAVNWRLVLAGAGIGAMQRSVGDREPAVARVLPELPMPSLPVWLTAHEELRASALIRRVFDHLAEALSRIGRDAPGA